MESCWVLHTGSEEWRGSVCDLLAREGRCTCFCVGEVVSILRLRGRAIGGGGGGGGGVLRVLGLLVLAMFLAGSVPLPATSPTDMAFLFFVATTTGSPYLSLHSALFRRRTRGCGLSRCCVRDKLAAASMSVVAASSDLFKLSTTARCCASVAQYFLRSGEMFGGGGLGGGLRGRCASCTFVWSLAGRSCCRDIALNTGCVNGPSSQLSDNLIFAFWNEI